MPAEITGGSDGNRRLVRLAYERVMEVLPSDGAIPIHIVLFPIGWPSGVEARSTPTGVKIAASAIWRGPPGRPEYLLYEEIAHHIAADNGLPHGGNAAVFLQELFAGFVKFTLARTHDPQLFQAMDMPEIGTKGGQRFYGFGTDLGALLAGVTEVGPIIERFLSNGAVAEAIRAKGREVMEELLQDRREAPGLLEKCLALYPGLRRLWDPL